LDWAQYVKDLFFWVAIVDTSFLNFRGSWLWGRRSIISYSICWSALAIFIYTVFSGSMTSERPLWYRLLTAYGISDVPILASGLLCLRNAYSKRIPSGRNVWLLIGLGLLSFLIGNVFFASWELVWHLSSTGCLGDPFFVIFYILILVAMSIAITGKRIRLNIYQWFILAAIATYASILANFIVTAPPAVPAATPLVLAAENNPASEVLTYAADVPQWVASADRIFKPIGKNLNLFYVGCDIGLFCLSATVMFGCWGGKLSKAWRINALAVFFIYIADMWYAYAGNRIPNYQAGYVWEVGWVLGMILFGIAAMTEFEQSQQRIRRTDNLPHYGSED
jgi:hypothetical protein